MKSFKILFLTLLVVVACKNTEQKSIKTNVEEPFKSDFTIAFGSCNNQNEENYFWKEILKSNPHVWLWGGDIIYSDTYEMAILKENYAVQKEDKIYADFISKVEVMGTWDDHDYGINDGGTEYPKKAESQQLFLDFLDIPDNSPRRQRPGVYHSKTFVVGKNAVKVIVIDTRYFRTSLTNNDDGTYKRYKPNTYGEGTILGAAQWEWLEKELKNSNANFNVILSSIQVLSGEHGWETWGNMPHEVDKLTDLLKSSKAQNTILLSGDRHISDFSKKSVEGLSYPLIDFTSSGLTHSATNNLGEDNKYRVGELVNQQSFGILKFNFESNTVLMEMRGNNNELQQSIKEQY
ncbi:MAG: alkaline phosphatase [Bacteroidetes bacterium MedPE-SWsnd-G1]|nr:MAG: alkaline phosphatase [Bacteroidetes bacterium MedPE-SWsnd-G1]